MKVFSISVVIPNFNGRKLLEANLPSVFKALENSGAEFEVIVSDDCSSDDSITFIKNNYPQIILIESTKNRGFSPNINRGIFKAQKDLVLALNNDVKLTPNYFKNQFKYFENEDTFGVMGRIIGLNNDDIQDGAKYPKMKFYKIKATTNYIPLTSSPEWTSSFFLSGANALMDRKKLFLLNGYDETYRPFYLEDVDLSLRAWRMGWASYYDHDSICRHPASATILTHHKLEKVKTVSLRNRLVLHYIHLDGFYKWMWKIGLVFEFLFSWMILKLYFYKSLFQFYGKLKEANYSRNVFKTSLNESQSKKTIQAIIRELKTAINQKPIRKF